MRKVLCIVSLAAVVLLGCASGEKRVDSAGEKCEPTQPVRMRLPEGFSGEAAPAQEYSLYANADRSILWLAEPIVAGEETKRWWFRPAGEDLIVTGRRMDASAPPAVFRLAPGRSYPQRFMAGTVKFPTEGCWEVTAKAGQSAAK